MQKYPDLSRIRIIRFRTVVEAIIIHKNKSQYAISYKNPHTGIPYIEHITENRINYQIEQAAIFESPLMKAMEET